MAALGLGLRLSCLGLNYGPPLEPALRRIGKGFQPSTRRFTIRSFILIFAIVLAAEIGEARADMVSYQMTGTVIPLPAAYNAQSSVPVGTHVSWTLQYDNSTPLSDSSPGVKSANIWNSAPLITNTGYYVPSLMSGSSLTLSSGTPSGASSFDVRDLSLNDPHYPEGIYGAGVHLNINGLLPTFNLAQLQLNKLPIDFSTSSFSYRSQPDLSPGGDFQFMASVDSISNPSFGTPEPGSLVLFLVGIMGLATRGMRRQIGLLG